MRNCSQGIPFIGNLPYGASVSKVLQLLGEPESTGQLSAGCTLLGYRYLTLVPPGQRRIAGAGRAAGSESRSGIPDPGTSGLEDRHVQGLDCPVFQNQRTVEGCGEGAFLVRFGSLEWGRVSGGRLSRSERWSLVLQALTAQLQLAGQSCLRLLGLGSARLPAAAWRGLELPDSPLARSAEELCRSVSPTFLVDHCLRSFAWGTLLAQRDDLRFDPEVFYLACMLHDLGLTDYARPDDGQVCFAVSGAAAAFEFLGGSAQAERVAEAISLHLNVKVGLDCGTEAHLLRQGTGLDVVGIRLHEISPQARARVLERYGRQGFSGQIAKSLGCACHPGSRTELLCQLGFLCMIRRSPWSESSEK